MTLKWFQNALVSILLSSVVRSDLAILKSSDFEDKDIPYLLNWRGDAANSSEEKGSWSIKARSDEETLTKDAFDEAKSKANALNEIKRGFPERGKLVAQSRELEGFKGIQSLRPDDVPFNLSRLADYFQDSSVVLQPKQSQTLNSHAYDDEDDRSLDSPANGPSDEMSILNQDDSLDRARDQSKANVIPVNNMVNSKGVTISIMVPLMDLSQNVPQRRHSYMGSRIDKGGRQKGKLKDKKERTFGKLARKSFPRTYAEGPTRGFNYFSFEDSKSLIPEPLVVKGPSGQSDARHFQGLETVDDQWTALDKILDVDLRKREARELKEMDSSEEDFDDHVVRNKRLLFFQKKRKKNQPKVSQNNSADDDASDTAASTQKSRKKKKLSTNVSNQKKPSAEGKKKKHFRLWKDKGSSTASENVLSPMTMPPPDGLNSTNESGQPFKARISQDQQGSARVSESSAG